LDLSCILNEIVSQRIYNNTEFPKKDIVIKNTNGYHEKKLILY